MMTDWFLKAKHWQLFLGYVGIMLTIPVLMTFFFIDAFNFSDGLTEDAFPTFPIYIFIPIVLLMAYNLLYFWNVGSRLHALVPNPGKFKLKYLHWSLAYPVIYFTVMVVVVTMFLYTVSTDFDNPSGLIVVILVMLPLHFLAIICGFYRIYFMARLVKSVEIGRVATLDESIIEGLLFWFWFVGIWIIQPKVNEYYEKSLENALTTEN